MRRPPSAISVSPYTTGKIAARDRPTLRKSGRPAAAFRYSGSRTGAAASKTAITGTASRNTAPHQKTCSSAPPTSGPIAPPRGRLVDQTAMATVRCLSSRNMLLISERVDGISVAPANPSTARAPISMSALTEYAATSDAVLKPTAPSISSRRRPMRSPRVPMVTRKPARMNP